MLAGERLRKSAVYSVPQVNGIRYQCGVMGAYTGPNSICFYNCAACAFGSGSDAASANVLAAYPFIVQTYFFPQFRVPQVSATLLERRLTMSEIQQQIDAGRPDGARNYRGWTVPRSSGSRCRVDGVSPPRPRPGSSLSMIRSHTTSPQAWL